MNYRPKLHSFNSSLIYLLVPCRKPFRLATGISSPPVVGLPLWWAFAVHVGPPACAISDRAIFRLARQRCAVLAQHPCRRLPSISILDRSRRRPVPAFLSRPVGPRHLPTNQQHLRHPRTHRFGGRHRQHRVQPRQRRAGGQQLSHVQLMGELEQSILNQLLVRLHPFRKYIWAMCFLSVMLAVLIILNSVWIIASAAVHPVGDTSFVIFSEILAWLLLLLSGLGLKMTCMANKAVEAADSHGRSSDELPSLELALEQRRPFSAPNWVPTAGWPGADFGDLPGAVGPEPAFDPFLFPPPPPRYSSLELPAPVMVVSAATAAGRRTSQPMANRLGSDGFVRSPPPPYCPPS